VNEGEERTIEGRDEGEERRKVVYFRKCGGVEKQRPGEHGGQRAPVLVLWLGKEENRRNEGGGRKVKKGR
jgi:hypothetical protein